MNTHRPCTLDKSGTPLVKQAVACILFIALVLFQSVSAAANDEIASGKVIAEKLCARCHSIAATGESTLKAAPPFRTFSEKWPLEALEEALAEGIVTGHPDMPEFKLPPEDVGALISYLHSLQ